MSADSPLLGITHYEWGGCNQGPLVYAYEIDGREDDGAQCNGDFVTHLSSTVCTVNPSIQDPSGRADRWSPE
jgi:hypothetical protein